MMIEGSDNFNDLTYRKYADQAKRDIVDFIRENQKSVFYYQQLAVFFEKRYFHWVTFKAINELLGNELGTILEELYKKVPIRFIFHKGLRYYRREINKVIKIVRAYSLPLIGRALGRQAEVLFFNAFTNHGFQSFGQHTNKYMNKEWTSTKRNLDFVIGRDEIVYGCEVKNTLDYIDPDEFIDKLDMCWYLGIKPLFIMRACPKSYNWKIINEYKGYAMIFQTQIYPFGQERLVEEIKRVLRLPVDCPSAIPDGIIRRFLNWHEQQ